LVKSITKDSKGKLIYEYKDFSGQVILKKVQLNENVGVDFDLNGYLGWLSTYYVYDDFGRLRFTITPKAVSNMIDKGNWDLTDMVKGLCFYQEYDKRGRVIVKHAADGGEVWLVYDKRDRLVFTQDENQRNRAPAKPDQWAFSLYDEHDRTIATGLIDESRTRDKMQTFADANSTFANENVALYTGSWEIVKAYMPLAGRKGSSTGLLLCGPCNASYTNAVSYYENYKSDAKAFVQVPQYQFAATASPYVEPFENTKRINGLATGGKIRVLDDKYDNQIETDDKFLISTIYYDEQTRVIQTHTENIKGGVDNGSILYDYAGKVLSNLSIHSMPNGIFDNHITVTKSDYDLHGRSLNLYKAYSFNGNYVLKKLSEYRYDELGRVKTKKIGADPLVPSQPMETQDYSYNILGALTGVNKEYALAGAEGGDMQFIPQFSRRFGYYLGYANEDNKFTGAQYNGNVTGTIWRSQGDNKGRKYDYTYDNVDRFTNAIFSQKETPVDATSTWTNGMADFATRIDNYDANGNILGMYRTGIIAGGVGGVILDRMVYDYYLNSSKLMSVVDYADPNISGKQGDFKDYVAGNGVDYNYDFNGNLKFDKNKGIVKQSSDVAFNEPDAGIVSNFLDLPVSITIKDKSRTEYLYDAAGNKLAKKVVSLVVPPTTNPVTPVAPTKTTYFIGEYLYESLTPMPNGIQGTAGPEGALALQYIMHEEGKLRVIEPVNAASPPSMMVNFLTISGNILLLENANGRREGVWDYYLKDNLSNTRMVLTEEKHKQTVVCSMEATPPIRQTEEDNTFGANELNATRVNRTSTPWASNTSSKVSKLQFLPFGQGAGMKGLGPNVIFKVMAGDKITGKAKYYYQQLVTSPSNNGTGIIPNIITGLINAINVPGAVSSGVKDGITNGYLTNNNTLDPFTNIYQPTPANPNKPKAYINYIFFDEQFNYVEENSYAKIVDDIPAGQNFRDDVLIGDNKTAPKNGYVYVYISNDSRNIPVYFDDFMVTHTRGAILEDNAYYPYGLKIAGISSRAAIKPQAKEGYQGDYAEHDEESGYDEFMLRNYDAQIGRWIQNDPYEQYSSGYLGMGGDPVNRIDKDGGFDGWVGALAGAIGGGIAGFAIANNNGGSKGQSILAGIGGAVLGAGLGYAADMTWFNPERANSFFGNFRSFYAGMFGGKYVMAKSTIGKNFVGYGEDACPFPIKIDAPNVWDWVKLNWVDDFVWNTIDVQYWANIEGQNNKYNRVMTRTINGNQIQDLLTTNLPAMEFDDNNDPTIRYNKKSRFYLKPPVSWGGTLVNGLLNGFINQPVVFNQNPKSARAKLITERKEANGKQRLKILGIKTFIKRKI
jgi:RHS repeat-associated protein